MDVLTRVMEQVAFVKRPLYAVTLSAVARDDTSVVLMLHWHGFLYAGPHEKGADPVAIPSSALQMNDGWTGTAMLDRVMLEAAWRMGAWDLHRHEHRGIARPGVSAAEALACQRAFGGTGAEEAVIAEIPDRDYLTRLAARKGYVQWIFRPVHHGIWKGEDDLTLQEDGSRLWPCPARTMVPVIQGRRGRDVCRLGLPNGFWIPRF